MESKFRGAMTGGRSQNKKRILLVDDEQDILLVLKDRLEMGVL